MKGEKDKFKRGLDKTVSAYAPGAGMAKFALDFVPTMITGHKPQGSLQVEKNINGAKKLMREFE
jgi:hypothetical protein